MGRLVYVREVCLDLDETFTILVLKCSFRIVKPNLGSLDLPPEAVAVTKVPLEEAVEDLGVDLAAAWVVVPEVAVKSTSQTFVTSLLIVSLSIASY